MYARGTQVDDSHKTSRTDRSLINLKIKAPNPKAIIARGKWLTNLQDHPTLFLIVLGLWEIS